MMFSRFTRAATLVLGLVGASLAFGAQHPIAFQVWTGPVPGFNAAPNSLVSQANNAFLIKYGAERGLVGTAVGTRGELIVLTSHQAYSRQIWTKLNGAGDVSGNYFIFASDTDVPGPSGYQFLGRVSVAESSSAQVVVPNGTPVFRNFLLAMDDKCVMQRAGVITANPNQVLAPTRLVKTTRQGAYTIAYEFEVNGGAGALVSAIQIALGAYRGPFVIDICPVDVYIR